MRWVEWSGTHRTNNLITDTKDMETRHAILASALQYELLLKSFARLNPLN